MLIARASLWIEHWNIWIFVLRYFKNYLLWQQLFKVLGRKEFSSIPAAWDHLIVSWRTELGTFCIKRISSLHGSVLFVSQTSNLNKTSNLLLDVASSSCLMAALEKFPRLESRLDMDTKISRCKKWSLPRATWSAPPKSCSWRTGNC